MSVLPIPVNVERLADFYIRVGQTFDQATFDPTTYTQCAYQSTALGAGETRMFICDRLIEGRYVTVHFPTTKTEILILCEVAVYEGENILHIRKKIHMKKGKVAQRIW